MLRVKLFKFEAEQSEHKIENSRFISHVLLLHPFVFYPLLYFALNHIHPFIPPLNLILYIYPMSALVINLLLTIFKTTKCFQFYFVISLKALIFNGVSVGEIEDWKNQTCVS